MTLDPTGQPATGGCPQCSEPLECQPEGHHCYMCGFHDDQACDREFDPDYIAFPDMPATIVIPRDAFDAIVAVNRRRNVFQWSALIAPKGLEMPPRFLELAAAVAAGSTRLTPETAYRISRQSAGHRPDEPYDPDAEAAYWTVRDLIPAEQLREFDIQDEAEQAANNAEYIAWKAAQSEAGR